MADPVVLIVEDEANLAEAIRVNLLREGFRVHAVHDGIAAVEEARRLRPDVVVLDVMLPGLDGLEVCRLLRRESSLGVLMLTAKGEEVDRVVGLELGADDYVTKPFSMRELMARVRALARRTRVREGPLGGETVASQDLELDLAAHTASLAGKPLALRPREFDLLAMLVKHRGRVLTRGRVLDQLWGQDYYGDPRTVDVHIRWLREKIEPDPGNPTRLVTIRGVGYRFEG